MLSCLSFHLVNQLFTHNMRLVYICIYYRIKKGTDHQTLSEPMDSQQWKIGDLVFAKCTKCKPWPAKIIRIYEHNVFKVDFYHHNSFGLVDRADVQKVTFATIEKYQKIYRQRKNKDQILLMEGVKDVENDFKRRLQIENQEVSKWKKGIPTRHQAKRLDELLEVQIKKPVPKPEKKINRELLRSVSEREKTQGKGVKQQQREKKKKSHPEKEPKAKGGKKVVEKREKRISQTSQEVGKSKKKSTVAIKTPPENMSESKSKQKRKENRQMRKEKKIKKKTTGKKEKIKKAKKDAKNKLHSEEEERKDNGPELSANKLTVEPTKYSLRNPQQAERIQAEISPTEQLNTDSGQEDEFQSKLQEEIQFEEPQQSKPPKERQNPKNSQQSESQGIIDFSINSSFVYTSEPQKRKGEDQIVMVDEKEDQKEVNLQKIIQKEHESDHENICREEGEPLPERQVDEAEDRQGEEKQIDMDMEGVNDDDSYVLSPRQEDGKETGHPRVEAENTIKEHSQSMEGKQVLPEMDFKQVDEPNLLQSIQPEGDSQKIPSNSLFQTLTQLYTKKVSKVRNATEEEVISANGYQRQTLPRGNICGESEGLQQLSNKKGDQPITKQVESPSEYDSPQLPLDEVEQLKSLQPSIEPKLNPLQQIFRSIVKTKKEAIMEHIQDAAAKIIQEQRCDTIQALENRYADKSLKRNQIYEMVRSLPKLKRQLELADNDLMAEYVAKYAQNIKKFVSVPFKRSFPHILPMWKTQLFLGILDGDILTLKSLFVHQTIEKLILFVRAFQKSQEAQRSECHIEYMLSINRLDLFIYRFRKQMKLRINGEEHELQLPCKKWDSYDDLFSQFDERYGRVQ